MARLAGIPNEVIQRSKTILNRIENHAPDGAQVADTAFASEEQSDRPVQMDLFRSVEKELIAELMGMDIHATKPMEALQLLLDLQNKAKTVVP